ncbi:hypothetical protein SAMN05660324_2522 [Klenkia brasiliensis]|uniref:DUF91 domain-containing protein n=1 Tax=Klenkia brasiliensis TaxID=333142 RepID=A0A1G7TL93_9ACTN|nr:hypothetical protein SAMN05660324_2522 [Klenkia brasiliensis]
MRSSNGPWTAPEMHGYANEADMQAMLHVTPSLIDGVNPDAISVTEFGTVAGPADLVIVDTTGGLTLVECKLVRNPQIRREIVGQVFDYAARLAETTPASFAELWAGRGGPPLDAFFEGRTEARERFEADLAAGAFTLVLAVDRIHDDLRRIVRYLNEHTSAGVRLLAVELNKLTFGDTEVLVPTVYGRESADQKDARSSSSTRRWAYEDVDADLRSRDPQLADGLRAFEQEMAHAGFRVQGGGAGSVPSYSMWGPMVDGRAPTPFSVYAGDRPLLSCTFEWSRSAGEAAVTAFLDGLLEAGIELERDQIVAAGFKKRPSVSLDVVVDPRRRAAIVSAARRLLPSASDHPTISSDAY